MTLFEVRARGLYNSADRFSFGYKINSTATLATVASTFTSAITTFWTTATNGYEHLCFTDVALVDTLVYVLNSSLVVLDKQVTANAHAGTASNSSLTYGTSVTVSMHGNSDTKSDHGWMSLPTPEQISLADGLWTSAFLDSVKAILDPFFVTMSGLAGYSAVKINTHTNRQGDPPFTQHVVNAYSVSDKPGSARMRTKKQLPTQFRTGTI